MLVKDGAVHDLGVLATVVIPCYRRAEMVAEAVRSALEQDFSLGRFEVIVVDSSPDDAVKHVVSDLQTSASAPLKYFRKQPEGPGPSRNLGAMHGSGAFIAFLDSDCQASPCWLQAAVAAFEPGIGIVQGRTLPMPGKRQGIFTHTLRIERETHLYETANIVYSRAAFEAAGGFQLLDSNPHAVTPLGGEDVDLAWRVKRLGWRSSFCAAALVHHEVLPMSVLSWIWISRLQVFPWLVRRFPELRAFFFLRYFFDIAHAYLLILIIGAVLVSLGGGDGIWGGWAAAALALPYVVHRASEKTRSLRGPLRLIRPMFYILRDLSSLAILVVGSIRARSLLL